MWRHCCGTGKGCGSAAGAAASYNDASALPPQASDYIAKPIVRLHVRLMHIATDYASAIQAIADIEAVRIRHGKTGVASRAVKRPARYFSCRRGRPR